MFEMQGEHNLNNGIIKVHIQKGCEVLFERHINTTV